MGMDVVLCTLSKKRMALIEEDPEVLEDLLESRGEEAIPGMLDLGKHWETLRTVLTRSQSDPALPNVALLGETGSPIEVSGTFGSPRILSEAKVKSIAAALGKLPASAVRDAIPDKTEAAALEQILGSVVDLYCEAAKAGSRMLVAVV